MAGEDLLLQHTAQEQQHPRKMREASCLLQQKESRTGPPGRKEQKEAQSRQPQDQLSQGQSWPGSWLGADSEDSGGGRGGPDTGV